MPVYSYLSLTEESEYITTDQEYAETLAQEQNIGPDSPKFAEAMNSFRERMKHYRQDRVYPTLPDWPIICFYNMNKRRGEQRNWYALPYDERRKLMKGTPRLAANLPAKSNSLSPARPGSTTGNGA